MAGRTACKGVAKIALMTARKTALKSSTAGRSAGIIVRGTIAVARAVSMIGATRATAAIGSASAMTGAARATMIAGATASARP